MGEMTQEEIARVAGTLSPAMINAMVTGWQQIPGAPKGDVRCIETGVEIRSIGGGWRWEVLRPEWRRRDRRGAMVTERISTTKIEALGHATRATRPVMRERIAQAVGEASIIDAGGKAPTSAERIAASPPATDVEIELASRYALGLRARILKRLQVAEDEVARAVKRAQYDALRAMLAEVDGAPNGDLDATFNADDFRHMLNDAARKLGVREPWRSESGHV